MPKIFVKPARDGAVVRHPDKLSHRLKPEGEWVEYSIQWQRYLDHGDVIEAVPPEKPAKTEKPAAKPVKGGAQ